MGSGPSVEVEIRVHRAYKLLAQFHSAQSASEVLMEEFGVSLRTATRYIHDAKKLMRKQWEIDRKEWLELALTRMDEVGRLSMESRQLSNAVGAAALQAKWLKIAE